MFCRRCGLQIPDDSTFCPKCGTQISSELSASSPVSENIPSAPINPIHPENIALQSTLVTPEVISRIERVLEPLKKIADLSDKKAREQRYINQRASILKIIISYIAAVPISIVIMWFILLTNFGLISENKNRYYLIAIFVGFVCVTFYYVSQRNSIIKAEQRVADYLSSIDDICRNEIDRDDLVTIPPAYRYYSAALFFYNAFINQRALTVQQAVNLYEEELHRNRMEQMQQTNMRMLAQQNQTLNSINRNAATAATMSSLTYMQMLFK